MVLPRLRWEPRWVDLSLVVALVPLAIWAGLSGFERSTLEARYDRYVRKAGELEFGDPSKLTVRAIDTDEPLHFAWRMILPDGDYEQVGSMGIRNKLPATGGGKPIVYSFRIGETDRGSLRYYLGYQGSQNSSSTQVYPDDSSMAKLLRGRWNRVIIEQTAATEVVVADPSRPLVLLRLKLPDSIAAEAHELLAHLPGPRLPTIFELTIQPASQEKPSSEAK